MLEAGIAACDLSGSRAMAAWNRLSLAEIYLHVLLAQDRPSIKFILANLPAIIRARMFGAGRVRRLLEEASRNEQFHVSSTTQCRIEIDFAKLCRKQKQPALAREHLQRARLAALAQDSVYLLDEVDALSRSPR